MAAVCSSMPLWRILSTFCIVFAWICTQKSAVGSPREYCRLEPFTASCGSDSVVIMESAQFGRMKLGRCLKKGYGVLNCSTEILDYMDAKCSGHRRCETGMVMTFAKDIQLECLGDLAAYLKADFDCVKVTPIQQSRCKLQTDATNIQTGAYLTNDDVTGDSCGSDVQPLVIQAQPMQQINISLIDFGLYGSRHDSECVEYGHVRDGYNMDTKICGARTKESHVVTSRSNRIEVTMATPGTLQGTRFLLKYEVVGCAEPSIPSSMWLRREGTDVRVGCYTSRATWRLECRGDTWWGTVGNCSDTHKKQEKQDFGEETIPVIVDEDSSIQVFSNEIGIAAAVVTSVFLSILLLVIGLLYDRRRTSQIEREIIQVHVSDEFSWSASSKKPIIQENGQTQTLTKDTKPSVDNPQNYQRTSEWCQGQRPPSHVDHIYDTPSYFDLDPDYMAQANNAQFGTMANRDSYLQPSDGSQVNQTQNTLGNRDSYLQPLDNGSLHQPH